MDESFRSVPLRESPGRIFLRFLRFGLLAWGGPAAQIAMMRQELIAEERWVTPERFNRVLAVYQVLPGPEATELCVYFGMIAGGRLGGLLAGLAFIVPGWVLMFGLSWFYVLFGMTFFAGAFYGFQSAVAALIVRAVYLLGRHTLVDGWLVGIAIGAGVGEVFGVHFLVTLLVGGAIRVLHRRGLARVAVGLGVVFIGVALFGLVSSPVGEQVVRVVQGQPLRIPSLGGLFVSGLRSGLLTFGGAYTVIPFLHHDAVTVGGWMTDAQFLDGIALSGIIPAPLIIFATFVGYVGGGPLGALVMTVGIFLPAFAITLVGHAYLEWLIAHPMLQDGCDGVTAGVIGLIAVTAVRLLVTAITGVPTLAVFAVALVVLLWWKSKAAVAVVMIGAGVVGWLLSVV